MELDYNLKFIKLLLKKKTLDIIWEQISQLEIGLKIEQERTVDCEYGIN